MTITEKKPLLIQIPGERNPNELPMTASAVGYDFVQGNYIYYATGSDSWETAPPNGGGGSGSGSPGGLNTYVQFNDGGSTFGGVAGLTFNKTTNTLSTTNLIVSNLGTISGNIALGDAAADVITVNGQLTASNGLNVVGSAQISNGVNIAAGGVQVTGIVPGISAPYNNSPMIIDLASGQIYGPVIRSAAGSFNFAGLSLDQGGTYLGGIYGLANNPGSLGFIDGINFATVGSRNLGFNINNTLIGKFSLTGLEVTGSVSATAGFSGSLTKLTNGSDYLLAGTNIQLSTGSNGAVTITATGGGTPGGSNTQIQYNSSGSFAGVTNLTWDGATLNATGSFKGNLDGTASYATNAANALTASYVQNAVSSSYATVAVSLTTSVFNVALNGTANGIITNIGGIYIPASTTVTTKSLAYIGGSTASEVAVLKMIPINSVTVSASWVVTGTLTSVSLSSPATLGPGWYDLSLETGTVSQTAFGRGLYLTSGDI